MTQRLTLEQKEVLAQFYSNFALAWVTFGIIGPFFSKIENLPRIIFGFIASLIMAIFSLRTALKFVK